MANSPYTGVEHIEPNQAQKEVTANDGFDRLSLFLAESSTLTITGDTLISEVQFQETLRFTLNGTPGAGFLLEVPSTVKKFFIVNNQTNDTATVQVVGGGGATTQVGAGTQVFIYTDTTDVTSAGVAGGPGEVLVSLNDNNADFLKQKIAGGANVTVTETNDGSNETLTISVPSGGGKVTVSSNDTTADFLKTKLVAGNNVTITETNDGGNEKINIATSASKSYDFGMAFSEEPTVSTIIQRVQVSRSIQVPADMTGSTGSVATAPAAQYDIDVRDDNVSIGTISVATDGSFTFTTASNTAKTIAAGSLVTFVTPGTADGTIQGVAVGIQATEV